MYGINDYEVDGEHFDELAKAENRVKELFRQGYIQLVILKNNKPYSAWYKNKNGDVCCRRFR